MLIEFPSLQQAHRWYGAAEYREPKAMRLTATRGHAVFIDGNGFTPPQAAAVVAAHDDI